MPHKQDRKREYIMTFRRAKGLRVIHRGVVLESELPETLQKRGPKWLKTWPKVKLIRTRSKEKPQD
jgi:hypothetical protein